MTFKEFKKIIDTIVSISKKNREAYSLGIDLAEFTEDTYSVITQMFLIILTPEGHDWLEWFLYEKDYIKDGIGRSDLTAYHTGLITGERTTIVNTLDELYTYLVENDYIRCKTQQ